MDINGTQLTELVAKRAFGDQYGDTARRLAKTFLNSLSGCIAECLRNGDTITFRNLGKFYAVHYGEREYPHFITRDGAPMPVKSPAHYVPKFRTAHNLTVAINNAPPEKQ